MYAPGGPSDLKKMKHGRGYWIKMDQPGNLVIRGTSPPSRAIFLKGGEWNLVGYSSTEPRDIEACISGVADNINSVCEYNSEAGWSIYVPRAPNDLGLMKPGYGYWIKANQNCIWDLDEVAP